MRAAVTGSAGFIGRAVTAALLDRGDSVVALLRKDHSEPTEWRGRADLFRSDLVPGPPRAAMRDVDVVFHCAAQVRPTWEREAYVRNNVSATRNVLEAALAAGVRRVVHFSSLAVHGEHVDHRDADESTPFADPPPTPYVATKIESERIVKEFRGRGLDVVVLRPGWVWGPGDPGTASIARQLRRGRILMPGPGSNLLHLSYIENVAGAALLAERAGAARGEAFIVHDDLGLTTEEFVRKLALAIGANPTVHHVPASFALAGAACLEAVYRAMRRNPVLTRYQVAILARNQGFSVAKARRMLGFRPEVSLDEALARTARWITESPPVRRGSRWRRIPRRRRG